MSTEDWEFTHTSSGGAVRHYRRVWLDSASESERRKRTTIETNAAIHMALGEVIDEAKRRGASVMELARADLVEPGIQVTERNGETWRMTVSGRRMVRVR